jgi:hypothetical protein
MSLLEYTFPSNSDEIKLEFEHELQRNRYTHFDLNFGSTVTPPFAAEVLNLLPDNITADITSYEMGNFIEAIIPFLDKFRAIGLIRRMEEVNKSYRLSRDITVALRFRLLQCPNLTCLALVNLIHEGNMGLFATLDQLECLQLVNGFHDEVVLVDDEETSVEAFQAKLQRTKNLLYLNLPYYFLYAITYEYNQTDAKYLQDGLYTPIEIIRNREKWLSSHYSFDKHSSFGPGMHDLVTSTFMAGREKAHLSVWHSIFGFYTRQHFYGDKGPWAEVCPGSVCFKKFGGLSEW